MSSPIFIDGVELVSASEAGISVGYTCDYITKLVRERKIFGKRIGHRWFVDLKSAQAFKIKNDKEKKERHEAIRQERLKEQIVYKKQSPVANEATTALTQTLAILLVGVVIGLGGFTLTNITTAGNDASVMSVFGNMARSLFGFVSPSDVTQSSQTNSRATVTTYTSLIIAPDEVFTQTQVREVRDAFSDEVSISVDPNNPDTGIIIPHFRDKDGTSYRYLLTPLRLP